MSRWRSAAACTGVGPEVFFDLAPAAVRRARAWCAACPVRAECADHARTRPEPFGVWGGETELERYLAAAAGSDAVAACAPPRRGPDPALDDEQLARILVNADRRVSVVELLRASAGIGPSAAYKYAARAVALGLAERRGRRLFPASDR